VSQIDTTFSGLPGPLLKKWGRTVTFLKASSTPTYNTTTGNVTLSTTSFTCKAVITRVQAEETNGLLRTTDYKLLLDPGQIGGNYITTNDSFSFTRGNRTIRAKVIDVTTLEGDAPVMYLAFVRPE
jgi:hypothetical protein